MKALYFRDEVVSSTINFSRKNYADYFPENPYPEDVKMVGNTIKSKKMPEYIAKFLAKGIRFLLKGQGQEFLEEYYNYIDKIYNYKIPLRDIASKGKIKKSIKEYLKDIQEITKAGRPKSRQAWYELAIKHNLTVNNGDTIYYINTGSSKSHSDVKKTKHYYEYADDEKVDVTKRIEKEWRKYSKENDYHVKMSGMSVKDYITETYGDKVFDEDEIVMNCVLLPYEIINKEEDTYCSDVSEDMEYNVAKYMDQFNKRITPLLVCFSKDIRSQILITNPKDRPYFTSEQCELVSGEPNKVSDQDTYEQLMTMEDKEIKFWMNNNLIPPFIEECGMGKWEDVVEDYNKRMEEEKQNGVAAEKQYYNEMISKLSSEDIDAFLEDGKLPSSLNGIVEIDPLSTNFLSVKHNVPIGSIDDFINQISVIEQRKENSGDAE